MLTEGRHDVVLQEEVHLGGVPTGNGGPGDGVAWDPEGLWCLRNLAPPDPANHQSLG